MELMTVTQESLKALRESSRTYTWLIKRFSRQVHTLRSRAFTFPFDSNIGWRLQVMPDSVQSSTTYSNVILGLVSRVEQKLPLSFSLSFLDKNGRKLATTSLVHFQFSAEHDWWGSDMFMKRDDLLSEIADLDDWLIVLCEINPFFDKDSEIDGELRSSQSLFISAFHFLIDNMRYSDVTLISSDGMELPAHKVILAARSPVFDAMFQHNMAENQSNQVRIEDIDYRTLKLLLEFLYFPKLPVDHMSCEDKMDLLTAANKYGITSLQNLLEIYLMKDIDVSNACDLLLLSERVMCGKLKNSVMKFICSVEAKPLFATQQWKDMVVNHPHLLEGCFHFKSWDANFNCVTE